MIDIIALDPLSSAAFYLIVGTVWAFIYYAGQFVLGMLSIFL